MGLLGSLRSIGAAMQRYEREIAREERERRAQERHAQQKIKLDIWIKKNEAKLQQMEVELQQMQHAHREVEEYKSYMAHISSLHIECGIYADWESILKLKAPTAPAREKRYEEAALLDLAAYKSTFWDIILRKSGKKRAFLEDFVKEAISKDEDIYSHALNEHRKEVKAWERLRGRAERVINGDTEEYKRVIEEIEPFKILRTVRASIALEFPDRHRAVADLLLSPNAVVPSETKSLLASGKLSQKRMAQSRYHETCRSLVCSAVLRVARECFAILPLEQVVITVIASLVDGATGAISKDPILSILIEKSRLKSLNMRQIVPTEALRNFKHSIGFTRMEGFQAIERINPEADSGDPGLKLK